MKGLILSLSLFAAVGGSEMPRHRVAEWHDKDADFAALHTYAWATGWTGIDPAIDRHAVVAIDRQLAGLGFMKRDSEPCDVLVTYSSLRRIDVDLDEKTPESGHPTEYPVGTLMVRLLEPQTRRELFQVRADLPLEAGAAKLPGRIDAVVAKMFKKYPTRETSRP